MDGPKLEEDDFRQYSYIDLDMNILIFNYLANYGSGEEVRIESIDHLRSTNP